MKKEFKLKGLNKPWTAGGFESIYATVEQNGKGDWFHCAFDKENFPDDMLNGLFDMFKNSDENLWSGKNHKVAIEFYGSLKKPIIKELFLDDVVINNQPCSTD